MNERVTIDGRKAWACYMRGQFEPCEKQQAELIKLIFDDGEMTFLLGPAAKTNGATNAPSIRRQ